MPKAYENNPPKELNILLQSLIHSMPDIVVFKDPQGRHCLVNKATEDFTGFSSSELVGRTINEFLPHELAEKCRKSDEEALRGGSPVRFEETFVNRNGSTTILDTIKTPVHDKTGNLMGLMVVSRDITQMKKTERALQKSEAFVQNILDSVDQGFIVVDLNYRILSANREYLQQVQKSSADVLGRPCYEVSHNASRPCFEMGERCVVTQVFDTEEPAYAMHVHKGRSGESVHVETKGYPLRDETGTVVAAIETITNVTEKTKLEDQLRHFQRIEAIGRLAGGIAHDFSNIITAIVGFAHITIMQMSPDEPLRVNLEQILKATDRAISITQGLLSFSRKQVMDRKPMDLNESIMRIEPFLLRLIRENIELKTVYNEGNLTVFADSGQLDQVLMNLVTNARDAMPDGGRITIKTEKIGIGDQFISTHGYGQKGVYALISIVDTGKGMNKATTEKIFEPFFTTKAQGQGTGLGLSMVYGIVKQHNGFINVYSDPGLGTTFTIYLPLAREHVQEMQ